MLGHGQLRGLDVLSLADGGEQLGELVLRLTLGAAEGMVLDLPLAGDGIAAGVELQLPRPLAALADVALHDNPSRPLTPRTYPARGSTFIRSSSKSWPAATSPSFTFAAA